MKDDKPSTTTLLLQEASRGDRKAREELCRRLLPRLQRIAHARLPGSLRRLHETDDIVHESLMNALAQIERFQGQGGTQYVVYIRKIIMNAIVDCLAKRRDREPVELGEAVPGKFDSPSEIAAAQETLAMYDAALERLREENESQFEAHILRMELGLTYDEIAAALGKPSADAARMDVVRARMRLAEILKFP